MDDQPLVSVIVSTHNRPDFLIKTLQSILNQTYPHLEVFVISNGINSKNKQAVDSLNDPRVKYKDQENSGGPSSPRNHGIRLSKGKYLAFCDDDDLWMSDKIEKQVKALEESPDHGLCYTKMMRFDETHEWAVSSEEGCATFDKLLYNNTIPISSLFVRKKLVELYGGFNESKKIRTSEDYEFVLRYALCSKFLFIDDYLIKYWSGNNRETLNNPNISKLFYYFLGITGCYHELWKMKKAAFSKLFLPLFYHLKLITKIFLYHLLVKTGIKK